MRQKGNALFAKRHTRGNGCVEKRLVAWWRILLTLGRQKLPLANHVNGASPTRDNAGDEKDIVICRYDCFDPQCRGMWFLP
jgi:hypothetical protein